MQECSRVSLGLAARTSQGRIPFLGDTAYSSELVRFSKDCKGLQCVHLSVTRDSLKLLMHTSPAVAGSQAAVDAALRIFRSCFGMSCWPTYMLLCESILSNTHVLPVLTKVQVRQTCFTSTARPVQN